MIKRLFGLLLFAAGIAVIVAVVLRRNDFRSMTGWEGLNLRPHTEKPLDMPAAPHPAATTPEEAADTTEPQTVDSLAAPLAADSLVAEAPDSLPQESLNP